MSVCFLCILKYLDSYYLLINVLCDRIVTPDVGGCNTGRRGGWSVIYPVSAWRRLTIRISVCVCLSLTLGSVSVFAQRSWVTHINCQELYSTTNTNIFKVYNRSPDAISGFLFLHCAVFLLIWIKTEHSPQRNYKKSNTNC